MTTVTIELPEDQIVDMIGRLSAAAKRAILKRLLLEDERWEAMTSYGGTRMVSICAERGMNWATLDEEQRLQLVDEILHEK